MSVGEYVGAQSELQKIPKGALWCVMLGVVVDVAKRSPRTLL